MSASQLMWAPPNLAQSEARMRRRDDLALRAAAARMSRVFGECLRRAGDIAQTLDELDDMVELSVHAHLWVQAVCSALGLEETIP